MAGTQQENGAFGRALVIDDHPLFCDALGLTLRNFVGIAQIDTADRLQSALDRLGAGEAWDVILLDLHLPDVSGLDGLVRLRRVAGAAPIVVVSSMADRQVVAAAVRAGARGFVPKHSEREVFLTAFRVIAAGGLYLPDGMDLPDAPGRGTEEAIDRLAQLTPQQATILHKICCGAMNKQIAYDLSIAETTVKAHVTSIMRKLGVQTRTQAVLLAKEASFGNMLPEPPAGR
ncbi:MULTISPECIES: response regulator [Limimaricola]|uniref:DNA-binding response regulator n=1 Tax=Limimaricola cinnabarinus TaxID=1125964 RepID=A0A2G1MCH3_9RHOB|nr:MULTISPECIES: response regulator transcription factor [Limimaricola]MCZ4262825.1 response regulator transcription factor [Limimaricola sp. G21655-S1]PHP26439.1 DNA-binding response regulator [Limimaricola cinnabarinus]